MSNARRPRRGQPNWTFPFCCRMWGGTSNERDRRPATLRVQSRYEVPIQRIQQDKEMRPGGKRNGSRQCSSTDVLPPSLNGEEYLEVELHP
jgi:hypothetical protein